MSSLSTLLLIIFYLIFRKRNNDKKFWVIFLYLVLSLASDILGSKYKPERFYIFSAFTLIEYTIFSYFFYLSYKVKTFKRVVIICSPIFFGILAYSVIFNYRANLDFDYLSSSLEAILLIIFSILFFYEQLTNPEIYFVYASKSFWVVIAILIYTSSVLFLFISTTVILSSAKQTNQLWLINNGANIIKNVLFAIAFWKRITLDIDSSRHKT